MVVKQYYSKEKPDVLFFRQDKHLCNDHFRCKHEYTSPKFEFNNIQNNTFQISMGH